MSSTTLRRRLGDRCFEWFQRRCSHDPRVVSADLFDAGFGVRYDNVQWCLRCGAARKVYMYDGKDMQTDWHQPRATWSWWRLGRSDYLKWKPGNRMPWRVHRLARVLLPDRAFKAVP